MALSLGSPASDSCVERSVTEIDMPDAVELVGRLYDCFNARDMETLLSAMQEDVIWANGMDGSHVHGHEGVRSYWTRQWAMIDPRVEPVAFSKGQEGEVIVKVHQIVRDLDGNLLADGLVGHVFRLKNGLVQRFDIREEPMPGIDFANLPAPKEGILVTLFITVRKVARSRDFYSRVLGGTVVVDENPCIVKLSNSWIIMNPGTTHSGQAGYLGRRLPASPATRPQCS